MASLPERPFQHAISQMEDISEREQEPPHQALKDEIFPPVEPGPDDIVAEDPPNGRAERDGQDGQGRPDREPDPLAPPSDGSRESSSPTRPSDHSIPEGHPIRVLSFPPDVANYHLYTRWIRRIYPNRLCVQHILWKLQEKKLSIDFIDKFGDITDEDIERLNREMKDMEAMVKCLRKDPYMLRSGKTLDHVMKCYERRRALRLRARKLQDSTDSELLDDTEEGDDEEDRAEERWPWDFVE